MRGVSLPVVVFTILIASFGLAQDKDQPLFRDHLGQVSFEISCKPALQQQFDRGIALLHSFQYALAKSSFEIISQQDPDCAIAFWGEAMSLYHQIWHWPSYQDLKQGHGLLQHALQTRPKTTREQKYIQALLSFYDARPGVTRLQRKEAYAKAMSRLYQKYPKDIDAAAFYALSLLALGNEGNEPARTKAIGVLTQVFHAAPNHPGAAHYLIHATDTPVLAPKGLQAAQLYATIAPSSAHALHMPSHIFAQLGLWPETIASNLASAEAASNATRNGVDNESGYQLHAMKYLEYAYLQIGNDSAADRIVADVRDIPGIGSGDLVNDSSIMHAQYVMESHKWDSVDELVTQPAAVPFVKMRILAARVIAQCRLRKVHEAETDMEELLQIPLQSYSQETTGRRPEIMEAEAWLAFVHGNDEEAERQLTAAVAVDRFSVDESVLPASELLGDLLLELNKPGAALEAYADALKEAPNRFNSLYGAGQAAMRKGDHQMAGRYFARLAAIADPASTRPEFHDAMAFLKSNRSSQGPAE
ncbi:MAG TPA: tetratricopeptide repeat protein [Candidatus Angelobacter sp.]|nr:tetratricopeptide repeat protein [Candidatus Angelobacter sp.]